MLGVSGIMMSSNNSGGGENRESGGGGGGGAAASGGSSETATLGYNAREEEDKMEETATAPAPASAAERNNNSSGGNRWPRQETIALLKIRSEMDVIFRDSSLKGPLWDEVSRKMADLGYHRSAKKCKEKFENVYKYHKRTKDGRASKSDGKTYRFFEHLEALENNPNSHSNLLLPPPPSNSSRNNQPPPLEATPINMAMPMSTPISTTLNVPTSVQPNTVVTVSSASPNNPFATSQNVAPPHHQNVHNISFTSSIPQPSSQPSPQPANPINTSLPSHHQNISMSYSTSSSTSSDEDIQGRHKKKRKWKDFFERLMKDVIDKQDELQRRFLETLEKRERDWMVREEAWRVQETARMNREHDLLLQERSMAAARDAAVIEFLQKVSEQQNIQIPNNIALPLAQVQIKLPENPPAAPTQQQQQHQQTVPVSPQPVQAPVAVSLPMTIATPVPTQLLQQPPPPVPTRNVEVPRNDNGGDSYNTPGGASSSRWPKAEVQALIMLRTNLDVKYQENGPKGPLWEEISAEMRKLGYNRNPKRCKEKWENINKYFKKVKESNKRRPEDSKTCPYFHQLDALYRQKATKESSSSSFNPSATGFTLNPVETNPMAPIMARPEQQWPLPPQHQQQQQQQHHATPMDHDQESDNMDEDEEDDEEEDEDEENAYEIVTNKQQSSMQAANTMNSTTTTTTATTTV